MKTSRKGYCDCCGSGDLPVVFYEAGDPQDTACWLCHLCANTPLGNWHRYRRPDVSNIELAKMIAQVLNLQAKRK